MTTLNNIMRTLYPQDPEDDSYVTRLVVNGEEVINSDQQAFFEDVTVTETVICDDIRNSAGEPYSSSTSFGNIEIIGSVISTNNNTAIKITKDLIVGDDKFFIDSETGNTSTVGSITAASLTTSGNANIGGALSAGSISTAGALSAGSILTSGALTVDGLITKNIASTTIFAENTDPTNNSRAVIFQNTNTASTSNQQVGLSFGISPLRTFSNATGGGRCLFDLRLVRNNMSDSRMIFSAYDNTGIYRDIAFFDRTVCAFNSSLRTIINSTVLYNSTPGNDPTNTGRFLILDNDNIESTANLQSILSFGISPARTFSGSGDGGRCLFDMRLVRNNFSNSSMIFSAFDNTGIYSDVAIFNKTLTEFKSAIKSSIVSTAIASVSDPGDSARSLILNNDNTSSDAGLQSILSFGISPNRTFGIGGLNTGRCLFDMRLIRGEYTQSQMVFSSYSNSGSYFDIAKFGLNECRFIPDLIVEGNIDVGEGAFRVENGDTHVANKLIVRNFEVTEGFVSPLISQENNKMSISASSTNKRGMLTVNHDSGQLFADNTIPSDDVRVLSIQNPSSDVPTNQQVGLSFGLSPTRQFGSVGIDNRCLFDMRLVRVYGTRSKMVFSAHYDFNYTDMASFNRDLTEIMTNLTVGTSKQRQGLMSVNYSTNIAHIDNTDPDNASRTMGIINSNPSAITRQQSILSFAISPQNEFGVGVGNTKGRCLTDIKLVRDSYSDSSLYFGGYDNTNSYADFAKFNRKGSEFAGSLKCSYNPSPLFATNTDPGDSARGLVIQNITTESTANKQAILSFGITPTDQIRSSETAQSRCVFDMRMYRTLYSNCSLAFSVYRNGPVYEDLVIFDHLGTIFNTRVLCNVESSSIYNPLYNDPPGESDRALIIQNRSASTTAGTQAIMTFKVSPTNSYGGSTGQGACLMDVKLVRNSFSNSNLVFSGYGNSGVYTDIAKFGITSSTFISPLNCQSGLAISSGGLAISSGGLAISSGGLTINGGGLTVSDGVENHIPYYDVNKKLVTTPNMTFVPSTNLITLGTTTPVTVNNTGILRVNSTSNSFNQTTGCAIFLGGVGVSGIMNVGELNANGIFRVSDTTAASSRTTGCARFSGGIGVNAQSYFARTHTTGQVEFQTSQYWTMTSTTSNWHNWRFGVPAGNNPRVYFANVDGTVNVGVNAGSFTPFSGCHVARNIGSALTASDIGKLFKLDGTLHKPTEILNGYTNGKLCDQDMSKAIYGIICEPNYLDNDGNNNGDILVLSVGEGGCLVHDDSGTVNIECGDILVSRADGYARKLEDSEFTLQTIKYVVARARETYNGPSPYLLHVTVECG